MESIIDQDVSIVVDGVDLLLKDPDEQGEILYDKGLMMDSGEIVIPKGSNLISNDNIEYTFKTPNGVTVTLDLYEKPELV